MEGNGFMSTRRSELYLARRERQILDTLYRVGEATVAGVLASMPDPPSYSCVRSLLRILERKGHVKHKKQGARYVYVPAQSREKARRNALEHVVKTFFDGSTENAVAALLNVAGDDVTSHGLDRIAQMLQEARKDGK
jgi:BlaI family transcriptional regulator, penicillinase repressor